MTTDTHKSVRLATSETPPAGGPAAEPRGRTQTRVVLAYAGIGAGHTMAAVALREAFLAAGWRTDDVSLIDIMQSEVPLRLVTDAMDLRRATDLTGPLYDRFWDGRFRFPTGTIARLISYVAPAFERELARTPPGIIVSTHTLPALVATHLLHTIPDPPAQVCVATDFSTHVYWPTSGVATYCVATEAARVSLCRTLGIPWERSVVTGIPLRRQFAHPPARAAARAALRIPDHHTVVLIAAGSLDQSTYTTVLPAIMPIIARSVAAPDRTVLLLGGRGPSERLEDLLTTLPTAPPGTLRVLGFAENMSTLMRAADVLVTKPGGLCCAEALAAEIPTILIGEAYGQERVNLTYMTEVGAALHARTGADAAQMVEGLLGDASRREVMRVSARAHAHHDAADRIVHIVSTTQPPRGAPDVPVREHAREQHG